MAVEAVVSVVTQKLTDTLTQESIMNQRAIVEQLEKIKKALETKEGYFLDAETESKIGEQQVKDWAGKYMRHVYDVEDAIETFAGRFPCTPFPRRKTAKLFFGLTFLNNFTACHTLKREIKRIRGQIDELNRNKPPPGLEDASVKSRMPQQPTNIAALSDPPPDFDGGITVVADPPVLEEEEEGQDEVPLDYPDAKLLKHTASTIPVVSSQLSQDNPLPGFRAVSNISVFADRLDQPRLNFSNSFDEEELDNIVGLKHDVVSLALKLLHLGPNIYSSQVQVVSIVGKRGSGKTTLARAVYGNREVKKHFKSCSAWVTASKESSEATVDLLLTLLRQIGSCRDQGDYLDPKEDPKQYLKDRISELLKDKQYLIVLEDVESREMWNDLRSAFPDQHPPKGSKLLLITCSKDVAIHANSQVHKLKKLSIKDSWRLFLKKAGFEECPEQGGLVIEGTQHPKTRILQVCNRLPLNIVLLGSLLSTKNPEGWSKILFGRPANWNTSYLISLSYNDLPAHLKLCLIYMVLFPKEFDIPVRRLQRLWLAEGFVKRSEESPETFQEDAVKGYLDDLVKRSLIQVSKLTSDGSPKRCRLLGVLHDYLSPKAQVSSLFHVHNKYSSKSCQVAGSCGVRRLVEYTDIKNCSLNPSQLGSLRSYMSFNIQKKDTPAKEVGNLLKSILSNGLKLLRVLDLEGVYKPSLPDNLGDFFNLRYLGLRWTFLDSLPDSIRHLHYLETLDIKHTHIGTLPPFIWRMKHLKHLNANRIHLDLPRHFHSLPQLMTLSGFSVDDKSLIKDGLKSLVHLRELEITFQLSNSEELLNWISKITAIQALRLRSKDATGRPSKIILRPLSSLKQLTHLHLLGNLEKLPDKDDFPPELKVLTLSVSLLKEDPMTILGELPKLTVLRLLANSFLGESMTCPPGGFKQLRVLKLWMLKNLEDWDVKEGSMERLKELNIRCCTKLKMIPARLLQQRNFKELTLTNMSQEFKNLVERRKASHVSLTTNHYKFSSLPWEEADGSSDEGNSMAGNGHTKN